MLEGLKALSVEWTVSSPSSELVGIPSERDISRALGRMHAYIHQSIRLSQVEKDIALLRWHTICMHMTVDVIELCQTLFQKYNIDQRVVGVRKVSSLDLPAWSSSTRARLGLLHAFSIYSILQTLPTVQKQKIHVPMAAFSAAMVYSAFLLGGVASISLPNVQSWDSVVLIDLDMPLYGVNEDDLDFGVRQYLQGSVHTHDKHINILYDISLSSRILKDLEKIWGISRDMRLVLENLSTNYPLA
jgi:hypothetical protein